MNDQEYIARRPTRLAVRACRIAFRNIPGCDTDYMAEIARRIQEVWEEEDQDLSLLATWDGREDADREMRRVYRERKDLPEEISCAWCGELAEESQARPHGGSLYCTQKCLDEQREWNKERAATA